MTNCTRQIRRPVSVVIIAKNEAARIDGCLQSVAWADEIVVVDSGSSDATVAVARRYTDKVYEMPWRGFGLQKQTAVELASHDLIFNIDCDEQVTPELAEEIRHIAQRPAISSGYTVPRRTFLGKSEIKHCGWYPDRTVRLFDRTTCKFSDDLVHEKVLVEGVTAECANHLLHFSFSGFSDMLRKMDNYTDLGADNLFASGRRAGYFDITIRPLHAFIRTYLFYFGFLDGFAGYVVSVSNAVSVFAKYVKLMERQRTGQEKKI